MGGGDVGSGDHAGAVLGLEVEVIGFAALLHPGIGHQGPEALLRGHVVVGHVAAVAKAGAVRQSEGQQTLHGALAALDKAGVGVGVDAQGRQSHHHLGGGVGVIPPGAAGALLGGEPGHRLVHGGLDSAVAAIVGGQGGQHGRRRVHIQPGAGEIGGHKADQGLIVRKGRGAGPVPGQQDGGGGPDVRGGGDCRGSGGLPPGLLGQDELGIGAVGVAVAVAAVQERFIAGAARRCPERRRRRPCPPPPRAGPCRRWGRWRRSRPDTWRRCRS